MNFFILKVLFLIFLSTAIKAQNAYTIWDENEKLTWEDNFVVVDSIYGARVHTDYVLIPRVPFVPPFYEIVTIQMRETSLFDGVSKNEVLLKHEQLHYDITEFQARLLRESFDSLFRNNPSASYTDYIELYNIQNDSWEIMQSAYDKDTYYSMRMKPQKRWEEKVDKLLKEKQKWKKSIPQKDQKRYLLLVEKVYNMEYIPTREIVVEDD